LPVYIEQLSEREKLYSFALRYIVHQPAHPRIGRRHGTHALHRQIHPRWFDRTSYTRPFWTKAQYLPDQVYSGDVMVVS